MTSIQRRLTVLGLIVITAWVAQRGTAHDQIPGTPQIRPIALVGGTVHTVDGSTVENGTVVFADGKITAVGKNIELPKACL